MQYTLPNRYNDSHPQPQGSPAGISIALAVSAAAHIALATFIVFSDPGAGKSSIAPQTLDVVLVNAKTQKKVKSNIAAQVNLEGGGNVDDDRRAKTPLPVSRQNEPGDDLVRMQRRQKELEAQQRQLMSVVQSRKTVSAPPKTAKPEEKAEAPKLSGVDLRDATLLNIPLEAEVNRRIEEESKRPRRKHIGTTVREVNYAMYVEQWRQKVERVGDANYPQSARGRTFGSLQMTVTLNSDGTVASTEVVKSSGYSILDSAAKEIVTLAAPYAAFPQDIKRDYEQLVITRTWTFAPGDKVFSD
jgi:periplasmic protein TonB